MRLLGIMLAVVSMIGLSQASQAKTNPIAKLGSQLNKKIQDNKSAFYDILIYMNDQADLSAAAFTNDKAEKGKIVYRALTAKAIATQKDLKKTLKANNIDFRGYHITNMIAAFDVPLVLIEKLAMDHSVKQILGNPVIKVVSPNKSEASTEGSILGVGANIVRTGADRVWEKYGTRGEGIVVANQDTGFDWDHPALKNQYRGWNGKTVDHNYNWHDAVRTGSNRSCGVSSVEPCDDNGHGTHTLGTVIGDDGQGNQVGMAPNSQWIGCRNMNNGDGRPSTYIECFEYFLAPWPYNADPQTQGDATKAAHVINNSWGCPRSEGCEGNEFIPVLEALKAAGIMVIAAAGNEGSRCSTIADGPAHHSDLVFSVGAIDHRNDRIASFSSRGPSAFDDGIGPDLCAPGVSVRSSIKGGGFSSSMWSGTSMASPHVAGAVALMWSAAPELIGDIDSTTALLNGSSEPKTSSQNCGGVSGKSIPNNTFGHGILNVYDALETMN